MSSNWNSMDSFSQGQVLSGQNNVKKTEGSEVQCLIHFICLLLHGSSPLRFQFLFFPTKSREILANKHEKNKIIWCIWVNWGHHKIRQVFGSFGCFRNLHGHFQTIFLKNGSVVAMLWPLCSAMKMNTGECSVLSLLLCKWMWM